MLAGEAAGGAGKAAGEGGLQRQGGHEKASPDWRRRPWQVECSLPRGAGTAAAMPPGHARS
jgi:hypothetical protein